MVNSTTPEREQEILRTNQTWEEEKPRPRIKDIRMVGKRVGEYMAKFPKLRNEDFNKLSAIVNRTWAISGL